MAYLPAPTPPGSPLPALTLLQAGGGRRGPPQQVPGPGGQGARAPSRAGAGGVPLPPPSLGELEAPRSAGQAPSAPRFPLPPLAPAADSSRPPQGAEPGSVGWGHRAWRRGRGHPHTGRGPPLAVARAGSGSVLQSAAYTQVGGGRVSPEVLPPPGKFPPLPCQSFHPSTNRVKSRSPDEAASGLTVPRPPQPPHACPGRTLSSHRDSPSPQHEALGLGYPLRCRGGVKGGQSAGLSRDISCRNWSNSELGGRSMLGAILGESGSSVTQGSPPRSPSAPRCLPPWGALQRRVHRRERGQLRHLLIPRLRRGASGQQLGGLPGHVLVGHKAPGGQKGERGPLEGSPLSRRDLAAPGCRREVLGLEAGAHLLMGSTSWAEHWEHWSAGDGPPPPPTCMPWDQGKGGQGRVPPSSHALT